MRWLVPTLAAVLLLPASAAAQVAWAKAYEDGIKAFEDGNYALAEQKLVEAREHPRAPDQSRRANFSSTYFKPFVPDLYIGLIYAKRGRHADARQTLERVLGTKLITEGERKEFALATSALQEVRVALARPPDKPADTRVADNRTPPPPANTTVTPIPPSTQTAANTNPGNSTTPATVRPPPVTPTEPAWLPRFRQAMESAQASLRESRYANARSHLASAESAAGDATRRQEALALRRSIDAAQSVDALQTANRARAAIAGKNIDLAQTQVARLESVAPGHAALAGLRADVERLRGSLQGAARVASVERLGVKLFLSGDYKESADQLERAVGSGITSPRIFLFLASSRAAQALLAPQAEQPALVAEAQRHYALARPGAATLAADQRFISPSIQKLLNGN